MNLLKTAMVLLIVALFGCEDTMNGPIGSELNYEPQVITVGKSVDFGTINEDVIKIKLVGLDQDSYILECSDMHNERCPLYADKKWMEFTMCNGKYKVTFLYSSKKEDSITMQLYKYERL